MILAGTSKRNIARAFECSHALWTQYQQTGRTADRQRPGFPRVTIPREDRLIRPTRLSNRYQTSASRTRFGGRVSEKTIRNRLRANNLRAV